MNNFLLVLLLLTGFLLTSCDESNDPTLSQVSLEMKAVTTSSTVNPTGRTSATDLEFTEAFVGVTEVELEYEVESDSDEDEDEEEYEIEFEGNYIVDLLNGTSDPEFGISELPPGLYEELEIEMESSW